MRGRWMEEENRRLGKQAYEPPRISVISLRPEEAVLEPAKTHRPRGQSAGRALHSVSVMSRDPDTEKFETPRAWSFNVR